MQSVACLYSKLVRIYAPILFVAFHLFIHCSFLLDFRVFSGMTFLPYWEHLITTLLVNFPQNTRPFATRPSVSSPVSTIHFDFTSSHLFSSSSLSQTHLSPIVKLTNWEKGKSLTTEFSNIPETVDSEFCQLLEDLDNDRIAPCPLIADVPRELTVSNFAEDKDYQEDNEMTFTGQPIWYSSRRIVSLVLVSCVPVFF